MPLPRPQSVLINGKSKAADALRLEIEASPLLTSAEDDRAPIVVEVQDGRFVFVLEDRPLGVVRFSGSRPDRKARQTLDHLAGYLNVRTLTNRYTKLGDALEVQLKRLSRAATKDKPGEAEPLPSGETTLLASGRSLVIEVTNRAPVPLHIYILDLDQDIRLAPLHPYSGFGKPIKPGETLPIGYGPEVIITLTTPKNQPEGFDHLLIAGSVGPANISALTLPALGEKYAQIDDLFGAGSRFDRDLRTALTARLPDAATALDPKDDWTAIHRTVQVKKA